MSPWSAPSTSYTLGRRLLKRMSFTCARRRVSVVAAESVAAAAAAAVVPFGRSAPLLKWGLVQERKQASRRCMFGCINSGLSCCCKGYFCLGGAGRGERGEEQGAKQIEQGESVRVRVRLCHCLSAFVIFSVSLCHSLIHTHTLSLCLSVRLSLRIVARSGKNVQH